jgi:hypothetical protein
MRIEKRVRFHEKTVDHNAVPLFRLPPMVATFGLVRVPMSRTRNRTGVYGRWPLLRFSCRSHCFRVAFLMAFDPISKQSEFCRRLVSEKF